MDGTRVSSFCSARCWTSLESFCIKIQGLVAWVVWHHSSSSSSWCQTAAASSSHPAPVLALGGGLCGGLPKTLGLGEASECYKLVGLNCQCWVSASVAGALASWAGCGQCSLELPALPGSASSRAYPCRASGPTPGSILLVGMESNYAPSLFSPSSWARVFGLWKLLGPNFSLCSQAGIWSLHPVPYAAALKLK